MYMAGGREFAMPGAMIISANLTPDKTTGLGNWSKADFIARFKAYDPAGGYVPHQVKQGEKQSLMPWVMYAGMTEQDLGAMFEYLKTIKPVQNQVETFKAIASK
jgi:hypothetical protein